MYTEVLPHHQRAIRTLVQEYQDDERFLALIIGGSVAKGCARPDSDIDFMIVATDEEYKNRQEIGDYFINRTDLTDYPGGYVDGKVINMHYLRQVVDRGNEPTRSAFDKAFIAFTKVDDLASIVHSIQKYPEADRDLKIRKFYSMSFIQHWLMGEAERHGNIYTKSRAVSQLVLFTGRLILAYNRVFFPYHKWFYEYLSKCNAKPPNLINEMNQVLNEPTLENASRLFETVRGFRNWNVSDIEAFRWFMEDVEWSWRDKKPPLEDW
ncbi:nucleotidyltransferase domain-containing protein [Hyunsoonleella rubra]|uniref:Nucleotidyltransferase domain-containing protein n=1 Tax=Hyunsoonleella rubra TaxID=1737062 RepID=A0ABW5TEW3_9FLAO